MLPDAWEQVRRNQGSAGIDGETLAGVERVLGELRELLGLGLPNSDKSLHNGRLLVDIARRAEELRFSMLGTIGRVAFPTYEELITLGAAAAVTERTGLMTDILLAATREPVLSPSRHRRWIKSRACVVNPY